jgi:pyruvate kinase
MTIPGPTTGRVRFICTIGPRLLDPARLQELAAAGMDIARVNGSHGTLEDVRSMVGFLKTHLPRGIPILLDLPGNKVRTDNLQAPVSLAAGQRFELRPENLTFRSLHARVKAGDRISASDGAIQLEVEAVRDGVIHTVVLAGGVLANRKGLNIRGIHDSMPFDFERDTALLNLAIEDGVDYVGLSFVRSSEHVRRIKSQLVGTPVRVVSKVETIEAVQALDRILAESDTIMVDRGDLEADVGRENVPLVTKRVVCRAREVGVPVIVASQFLTTMMERPLPVMAEVSDIANAVLDGASILMLSEETAVGAHPAACVATMREIARAAERQLASEYTAVILAAGPSTGFGSLTTNKHKCMLDVGGTTIIEHQLRNLRAAGIGDERIRVLTGHNHRQLEAYLRGEGFQGRFVHNPWFATTNILTSLWLARETGNLLLLYGDIIFAKELLIDLLAAPGAAALVVDEGSTLDPESEKVRIGNGRLVAASKELDPASANGEFIGLARFDRTVAPLLFAEMEAVVKEGRIGEFLTVAFERIAARGVDILPVWTQGRPWNDNDGLSDLDRSRDLVYPAILAASRAAGPSPSGAAT